MENNERIYMDYNATSPLKPVAKAVMLELLGAPLNPSSIHFEGRKARSVIENARKQVANAVGARSTEVIFTASATEANNTVLRIQDSGFRILVSATEHQSILNNIKGLALGGFATGGGESKAFISVDQNGVVKLDELEKSLSESQQPALVSVILVNNETGVINPLSEVVSLAKKYGALVHTDASQAAGKIEVNFAELGVDYMTLSGHKAGAPVGTAAMVVKNKSPYSPLMMGGGQEYRFRAGTENIPAIAAMGEVFTNLQNDLLKAAQIKGWRDEFENRITELDKSAIIHGKGATRAYNVSSLSMPDVTSETQVIAFDMEGISISAGSACTSGKIEPSHVLLAMGVDKKIAETATRVSAGWATEKTDFDTLYNVWEKIYSRANERKMAA